MVASEGQVGILKKDLTTKKAAYNQNKCDKPLNFATINYTAPNTSRRKKLILYGFGLKE